MEITERQKEILNRIILEHIKTAKPVSSEILEKKCKFRNCSATIRNEMKKLSDEKYIFQPHTSSGRVPTPKGYRFFVNEILKKKEIIQTDDFLDEIEKIKKEITDEIKLTDFIVKALASRSLSLVFAYLSEKDLLFKDGWSFVFKNPEFRENEFLEDFVKEVDHIEKNIKNFLKEDFGTNVYIGKEKSVLDSEEFSLIVLKRNCGIFAILGPSRMTYGKNISLINSLIEELK